MKQKTVSGLGQDKTFWRILAVSAVIGILLGIFAETPHWGYNILIGIGVCFLSLLSIGSAFMPRIRQES